MPNTTDLVTKTSFNAKVTEIPNVSGFDTKLNENSNWVTSIETKQVEAGRKLRNPVNAFLQ